MPVPKGLVIAKRGFVLLHSVQDVCRYTRIGLTARLDGLGNMPLWPTPPSQSRVNSKSNRKPGPVFGGSGERSFGHQPLGSVLHDAVGEVNEV